MSRKVAFKFKVKQEYEVVIYYENGIEAESYDDADEIIANDVLELAFNEEGLVVRTEDESSSSNPYIGLVTTFDPVVEEVYNIRDIPAVIKKELIQKGLLNE